MTLTASVARSLVSATLLLGLLPSPSHAGSRSVGDPTPTSTPMVPTATATPTGTSTVVATATGPTPVFGIDHFQCYEAHGDAIEQRSLSLRDQFGASTANLVRVHRICNPASKNGEKPSAPQQTDHLVGYTIRQTTPKFKVIRNVEVVNQFGTINVDVVRPEYLLVPSAKSRTQVPPPPVPGFDHYKCYRVKGAPFRRTGVTIDDQFGSIVVDVKRPRRLCVPVNKNGEGIFKSAEHLMCYQVRLAKSSPPFTPAGQLFIRNQFGIDILNGFRPTELCVPSFKNLSGCSVQRGFAPVCGGNCPPGNRCLFSSGPDLGGPDMGGPDMSGPECACRPSSEACSLSATTGACGGLCPSLTDACLFLSGPELGGAEMGGPETGCACRPQTEACALGFDNLCGGLCQGPDERCLSGPEMTGPDLPSSNTCRCEPATSACEAGPAPSCGGLCARTTEFCASFSGPDMGGPESCGCTLP